MPHMAAVAVCADAISLLASPLAVVVEDVAHVRHSRMAIPAGSAGRFIGAVPARRDRCVMFRSKKTENQAMQLTRDAVCRYGKSAVAGR